MNKRTWYLMLILVIAVIAAPVAASAQVCNPALYPPGIGFNPNVNYCLPNFAQSPNLRKFIDSLPGLGAANANNLGQYIPIATPDTASYAGSDYYEIGIAQYTRKIHTDLPLTTFRGYYQKNGTDPSKQYLGVAIVAQRNRPVRFKYFNELPTSAGNLFLPVDRTMMGAGAGPTGGNFADNRASMHLHGGRTPWISDGTPNQYITPVNGASGGLPYQKGLSFQNVPDMVNGSGVTCIGGAKCFTPSLNDGIGTTFYTNDQSARLMFYHDHAFGITRLNVYAGMAAPYLLTSQAEEDLLKGTNLSGGNPLGKQILPDMGGNYHWGIPLVIEDKSFVNDATTALTATAGFPAATSGYAPTPTTAATDPLWYTYVAPNKGGGSLWLPHEYMPIENIFDPTGNTPNGRWDYAPFLNPPMIPQFPTLPSPTIVPESFMDTMTVNGTVFPYLELPPDAVRFRILSVGNDRSLNLSWFKADPLRINVTNGGSGYVNPTVTITGNAGTYTSATAIVSTGVIASIDVVGSQHYIFPPTVTLNGGGGTCQSIDVSIISNSSGILNINPIGCTNFTSVPTVSITGGGNGTFTSASATLIPSGVITGIIVTGAQGYRSDLAAPTVNITGTGTGATAVAFVNTEVKMVDAAPNPAYPSTWPTDGRDGGVPDPATAGPPWIQIGNESGFLAQAAVIPANPLGYEQSRQSIPTLGVTYHSLLLMPAMRADVVVDFSSYKDGDVLILYNDGPAPMPGFWPLNDYYTDDPDQTGVGAAPSTPPGFGPNTRTVMQVRIKGTKTSAFTFDLASLQAALPKAFAADQDKPLVPQMAYNDAFPGFATFDAYATNKDGTLNLTGTTQSIASLRTVVPGNGYTAPPTVQILGINGGSGATATAGLQPMGGLTLLTAGAGYTTVPVVTIGTPASTGTTGGGVTATAIATISGGGVSAIAINEPGSNYSITTAPTCTVNPPTGCVINGTTCVQATCSTFVAVQGTVGSITLTNGGTGYLSEPFVFLSGGGGFGATADALLTNALVMTGKNITEGSDPDYGRLDIRLGSTPSPLTPSVGNGIVIGVARYIDPPTEMLNDGEVIIWRITHLGVDSHSLHFHLFDMQIVNHVDFTNVVKPPYPDELGWREVIRTNPMEDIIVAIKPRSMALPFPIPRSNRLLDPTNAINVNTNFLPIAPPVGIAVVPQITNVPTDFGWEYVWHCHILAHEENDMMRPMVLLPPTSIPPAPNLLSPLGVAPQKVTLNWTITPTFTNQVDGFVIQRCQGSATCTNFATLATLINRDTRLYSDATVTSGTTYRYQMHAFNNAGNSGNSLIRNAVETAFGTPAVTITSPVSGATFTPGTTIPLVASATSGTGATITNVAFYFGTTNLISTATTTPYTVNWPAVPAGIYPVTAVVTNSQGATATSSIVMVNVTTTAAIVPSKIGVFSGGTWYLDANGNGTWDGTPTDKLVSSFTPTTGGTPIVGDWNGSGTTKVGTYDSTTGTWYLDYNGNGVWDGPVIDRQYSFGAGLPGTVPVTGDWNGSGTTKVGLLVPSTGVWYLDFNGNGVFDGAVIDRVYTFGAGLPGTIPVTGDWNGSGTTKVGLLVPSTGWWYLDTNGNGTWDGTPTDTAVNFGAGLVGVLPVTGDWNASGTSKVGLLVPSTGVWYLDTNGNGVWNGTPTDTNYMFGAGLPGIVPVAGKW